MVKKKMVKKKTEIIHEPKGDFDGNSYEREDLENDQLDT